MLVFDKVSDYSVSFKKKKNVLYDLRAWTEQDRMNVVFRSCIFYLDTAALHK